MKELKSIKMSCGGKGCCPIFTLDDEWLLIEDDFGGSIKIKADRNAIVKTINTLFDAETLFDGEENE